MAFTETMALLGEECIGIVGAGHLGSTLASALIASGLPPARLLVCHNGSPRTRSHLDGMGLSGQIAGCEEVGRRCRIVIVTLRPQDISGLTSCAFRRETLLVSCVAGVSLARLRIVANVEHCVRIMPSAPYTIAQKRGIVGIVRTADAAVAEICRELSLIPIELEREAALHAFTALGVCLPIALAYWQSLGRAVDEREIAHLAVENGLSGYERVLAWALSVSSDNGLTADPAGFLASSATRGGVTQAILQTIESGGTLTEALSAGIERSRMLENDIA